MSWSYRDAHDDWDGTFDDRDCGKCIHRISPNSTQYSGCIKGCELWECAYEEKPPMSIEDAIDIINQEVDIDYGDRDEMEVERIDEAFDTVIAAVKRYIKKDCAEWNDWVDGATGRLTDAGTCNKCGTYNKFKTKFCPWCGRQMKNWKKGESK